MGETQDNDIGNKGIVSVRRLGDRMDKKDIASRFPKGLKVTTKVLAYDYMLQAYNCSLEKLVLCCIETILISQNYLVFEYLHRSNVS